jgi:flavodoxin/Pyruvate/2-oxoacid:ferredoxin oxidoreductase delta subunit
MPKCLIVYFSQTGATARTGERIAAGLHASGFEVKACNIKDEKPPDVHGYDMLGIGSPVYAFKPPLNVCDYVGSLPDLEGKPAFVFLTHGTHRFNAADRIRRELVRKKAKEVGYFHCRGADFYLQYLKLGYLFSADHPTAEELAGAEVFGREIATRVESGQHPTVPREHAPPLIYRFERLTFSRWLSTWVQSRLFKVDVQKCNVCGLCMARCPIGNITENKAGYPTWGRNCLLCLTCEMECPEEAIISLQSSSVFRPFMKYNVRKASHDPSVPHARVTHRRGHTIRTDSASTL